MQKSRVRQVGALLVGLALVAASCGDDKKAADTVAPTTVADTTPVDTTPVTDAPPAGGNELAGMKGSTPLVELSQDFKDRLATTPSGADLNNTYNYAAESYDAVVVVALAAAEAGTDGSAFADHIVGITKDGDKCTTFVDCMAIITAGGNPDYDGVSGPIEFRSPHPADGPGDGVFDPES